MKTLSRIEMKKVMGGYRKALECAANCNPGFVTIDCDGKCTTQDDVGVKCGTKKMCCSGDCNPQ
jgi:hypothetical protein